MAVWHHWDSLQGSYFHQISDAIKNVEARNPQLFCPVSNGEMIISSDYSGQHKEATHEAYSFLITTDQAIEKWLPGLKEFRQTRLPDNRRISFKKLNENMRWNALPAFLQLVGNLEGNLITFLIDQKIGPFIPGGPKKAIEQFSDCFDADAKYGTVEKMVRIAGFLALIVTALRKEDQKSHWISDHDEALDSYYKREQFARLSAYFSFGLSGWRQPADNIFGTTEHPDSPHWAEDFAAIPDLVAGAYCKLSDFLPSHFDYETDSAMRLRSSSNVSDRRARAIGNWLTLGFKPLRHTLVRLELIDGEPRASAQFFLPTIVRHNF